MQTIVQPLPVGFPNEWEMRELSFFHGTQIGGAMG